jgi:hypothetical protein
MKNQTEDTRMNLRTGWRNEYFRTDGWGTFMKNSLLLMLLAGLLVAGGFAQTSGAGSGAADKKEMGGFEVEQSVEFGYRFTDITGNTGMYDTLIDQSEGPRLLEQTFSMRSPQHNGALFDDLYVSSFGWGGDPENVARMRMSKHKWYDFTGLFRRNYNSFDYNLLANPLNPVNSNPSIPVNSSPHAMDTTRRMYDFGLTLLPESKFTVRLGFSRNRANGPSFSSFHEGTDVLLDQAWNITQNSYRFGVDYKILPKTMISYDQFLTYDKNDTDWTLAPFATFLLPNGSPVEFGLPFNTTAGQPCAAPVNATTGLANPSCNGYFTYNRTQRLRTSTPTEQLTLVSTFGPASFVGRANYSATDLDSPYSEFFDGLVTRTRERQFTFGGPAAVRRISFSTDADLTVEVSKSLRLNESFRFQNWRIPGEWDMIESATLAAGATATLLSPLGATTTSTELIANFLGMKTYYNLFQVEYSPTKLFGVNVGYRWRQRNVFKAEPEVIDPAVPFTGFTGDDITVNEYGPVFSLWLRPMDSVRLNGEAELTSADNFLTRISPKRRQQYRLRASYKPSRWGTFAASMNLVENRNNESDTQLKGHYRNYGLTTTLLPGERFNIDLSYNYSDALQNAFICYNGTFIAPGTVVNGCPTWTAATNATNPNPNSIYSIYDNNIHYFSATVMVKPVKRLTANLGYGVTQSDGNTSLLNILQPLGTLKSTYHQPLASLRFDVVNAWSLNAYWNYDQYSEGSFAGPTLPRSFHDNRTVLSVRYAF